MLETFYRVADSRCAAWSCLDFKSLTRLGLKVRYMNIVYSPAEHGLDLTVQPATTCIYEES